jgi:CBS domain-containing protein
MTAQGATSIIAMGPEGRPEGIVTDRDLRERVLAAGRSPEEPVASIMTAPLVSVSPEAFVFEALLEMTRHRIHHLLVVEGGRPLGVLSGDDLLRVEAAQPLERARAIEACPTLEALAGLVPDLTATTRQLFDEGLSGYELGRIIAELNDLVIQRVLGFVARDLGEAGLTAPRLDFCWLALGSEGRREQTLTTDQDNALVYDDPGPVLRRPAAEYFAAFAGSAIEGLVRLGYPRCPAGAMASNPEWCQPLAVWRDYIGAWARDTTAQNLMRASIHLDFRPVAGAGRLAAALREELRGQVQAWRSFPRYLGKIAVSHRPPIGLLRRFRVARQNGRRGINLKLGGLLLLNNALRAYAIELGLDETNTIERLEGATQAGCFTTDEAEDVRQAYETIFHCRLRHQLARLAAGAPPDNVLDPYALARGDQQRLLDAFRAIRRLQGKVAIRYFTEGL